MVPSLPVVNVLILIVNNLFCFWLSLKGKFVCFYQVRFIGILIRTKSYLQGLVGTKTVIFWRSSMIDRVAFLFGTPTPERLPSSNRASRTNSLFLVGPK